MNFHKTDINGGQGVVWDDFRFEQAAVRDSFYAWASAFGIQPNESFIFSGCSYSFTNGSNDSDGYDITAGYVCIGGEPCRVIQHSTGAKPSNSYTAIWVIEESDDPAGEKTFANNTVNQTYKQRRAIVQWQVLPPGANVMRLTQPKTLADRIAAKLPHVVVELGAWNMDTDATKTVSLGVDLTDKLITGCKVFIFTDADISARANRIPFESYYNQASILFVSNTAVSLSRANGGPLDNAAYSSTAASRGYAVVTWELD